MNDLIISRAIHTIRVNLKSLSEESKIIKKEVKRIKDSDTKNYLTNHRKLKVRQESRSTQLALAAIKGVPYSSVEQNAKTEPNWQRISEKFKTHVRSSPYFGNTPKEERKKLSSWIDEAKKFFLTKKI